MADYGSSPNNFLECVPSYVHAVAALQAGNTWMLRETAGVLLAAAGAGKSLFRAIWMPKTINLPRQARDKHRESWEKRAFSAGSEEGAGAGASAAAGRRNTSRAATLLSLANLTRDATLALFVRNTRAKTQPFIYNCDRFTKTGSGQT
jgi:hypothetical protein